MILKRLADSLRRQDWLAVLLEIAILIFGIFLGFQVTAWNEARKDQVGRMETLNLLQDELISNLETIASRQDYYAERIAGLNIVSEAVSTGVFDPEKEAEIERGLAQIHFFAPVPLRDAAFDALQQSGSIAELGDKELLIQLNGYRATVEWIASQHRSFRNGISELAAYWRPYVEHVRDPRPRVTTVVWDLEGLHQDRTARSALIEVERMYEIFAGYIEQLDTRTASLCEALATRTDRPCHAGES